MIENGYYYLEIGDTIKKKDEYSTDGGVFWIALNDHDSSIGKQWDNKKFFLPRRRKIKGIKFDSDQKPNWQ